jgi:DNA mismatch repair protein MutS
MSFIADRQTLEDLKIAGKFRPGSIFSLFNRVRTAGGERLLEAMFNNPLSDPVEINKRAGIIRYFQEKGLGFPFDPGAVEEMGNYLAGAAEGNLVAAGLGHLRKLVLGYVLKDGQYAMLQNGIRSTIAVLTVFRDLYRQFGQYSDNPYFEQIMMARKIVEDKRLGWLGSESAGGSLPFFFSVDPIRSFAKAYVA